MLSKRTLSIRSFPRCSRTYASSPTDSLRQVPTLPEASLETFRSHAFNSATPYLLPRNHFNAVRIPAIETWFTTNPNGTLSLNHTHLTPHASTLLPIELSTPQDFARLDQPLSLFLSHLTQAPNSPASPRLYIAQASLADLPVALQADFPTPDLVAKAGKGDVYASSLWLGLAPTNTPLHRDPNPNLFVQIAGRKRVRLLPPRVGDAVFAAVREKCGASGTGAMRGEEMMVGAEREELERVVWGQGSKGPDEGPVFWEAEVDRGDGLFIPKGWWHSIKSVGDRVVGSVNWWFR